MTPAEREARAELRSAILRSRMTPLERAKAAGHPSTYQRSGVSAQVPPCDATPETGGASAAADVPSAPTPFDDFHATVTSINVAADRLRALKGGRDGST